MMYLLLFAEFFKIGLFAIGGGMATIPFLFALSGRYPWFSSEDLVNMIAVGESTPGPIGVNMATYAGFETAGIAGSLVATLGLVLPSFIIIIIISKLLDKYRSSAFFLNLMYAMRPSVLALIVFAGYELAKVSLSGMSELALCIIFWGAIRFIKLHPIFYIVIGGILGVCLKL